MPPKKTKKAVEVTRSSAATATLTAPAAQEKVKAVKKAAPKKTTAVKKARKPAASAKAEQTSKFDPNCYVTIDHPANDEIVSGLHYAIRIGASENGAVEISFDGGDWQPCRQAAGYWWFDWGYFSPGEHIIVARLRDAEGNTLVKSNKVRCTVI